MAPKTPPETAAQEANKEKPVKKYPRAQPIQAPFDEPIPPEFAGEERAPADPLEHFRKHECGQGHKNWDADKIVYSMDNKRWILKCVDCAEKGIPSWYTISGSSMATADGVVDRAPVAKNDKI